MTAQIGERLVFRGGEPRTMCSEPLGGWLAKGGTIPPQEGWCSALWRGYVGSWEIRDDQLYLTGLALGWGEDSAEGFHTVFPDAPPGGVLADWCDDQLRVPDGEQVEYVHMGYGSTYERDLMLAVRGGRLVLVETFENRPNPASTDYGDRFTQHVVERELTPRVVDVYGPDEAAFLRAVAEAPEDPTPKLVYADWLEERADPRHELIRLDFRWKASTPKSQEAVAWATIQQRILGHVKDWLWLKVLGFELPRDRWGRELLTW